MQTIYVLASSSFSAKEGFLGRPYDNITTLHPAGLAILALSIVWILSSKRSLAFLPFIAMACLVSGAQRIVIFGVDFDFNRLLILAAAARIALYGEWRSFQFQTLDTIVCVWALTRFICASLLWMDPAKTQWLMGTILDNVGAYLVFRNLLRDWSDLQRLAATFAWIAMPVALLFVIESATGRNVFSVFGGVPEFTVIRQGKLRCQGAFSHPIVAGCFWAASLPLIIGLYAYPAGKRILSFAGATSCLLIILACSSSTPVFGVLMGSIAIAYWFYRAGVPKTLWGLAIALPVLHFAMEAPVWHLISRVSAVGGSTAWHRYNLIDQAINRFPEWALVGTRSTYHWGHFLFDVANQYVGQGVAGGVLTLILFVAILVIAFRSISRVLAPPQAVDRPDFLIWCLGASMVTHSANFIGISYFGQATMLLYLHLAMIGSLVQASRQSETAHTDQDALYSCNETPESLDKDIATA